MSPSLGLGTSCEAGSSKRTPRRARFGAGGEPSVEGLEDPLSGEVVISTTKVKKYV